MNNEDIQIGKEYWVELWPVFKRSLAKRMVVGKLDNGNVVVGGGCSYDEVEADQIRGIVTEADVTRSFWWNVFWRYK